MRSRRHLADPGNRGSGGRSATPFFVQLDEPDARPTPRNGVKVSQPAGSDPDRVGDHIERPGAPATMADIWPTDFAIG